MWSGFDVISLLVLAFEFSDSFFYMLINNVYQAIIYICIHIKLFEDFFRHMYMQSFLFIYIVLIRHHAVFVQIIPEYIICPELTSIM